MKYKQLNISLGNRIKQARIDANLTQSQLHELTCISITQLSNYENGSRNIGIENLAKIAKATHTTIDKIYFGDESEQPITKSSDDGELIINCVAALVEKDVIGLLMKEEVNKYVYEQLQYVYRMSFIKYEDILEDFVKKLVDFYKTKDDYPDPESFKKQLLKAAANAINKRK